jgi:hypothetical protein
MSSIDTLRPKTTIILGMAKIVQNVQEAKKKRRTNINQQVFGNVFLDDKSSPNKGIFGELARKANKKLHRFEPR